MALVTLHDLMLEQLRDVYSAEKQIVRALPGVIRGAADDELRAALREHLTVTEGHVGRLNTVFEELAESSRGKKCKGMEGLLEEGKEVIKEGGDDEVIDAGLIAAAQRVEHYEIAAYGAIIAMARQMQHTKVVELLEQTLEEEKEADATLTTIAKSKMSRMPAMDEDGGDAAQEENGTSRRAANVSRASGPKARRPTQPAHSNTMRQS